MGNILETECAVTEWVEQRTQPPDGLQAAGSDAHLALFFLAHVCRAAFYGIGIGTIGNGVSLHDDAQGEYEVVEQRVCPHFLEQLAAHGKQLTRCAYCRIEACVERFEGGFVFPV